MTTTQVPSRRERAKAERRARILQAASDLLGRVGYDRMTMAEVSRHADVGAGTVFEYAQTKAELLMMATADRWGAVVPQLVDEARSLEAPQAIRHLLSPFVEASLLDTATAVAIARELLFGAPGRHRAAVQGLVDAVEEAIAGHVADDPADGRAAARLIVSGAIVELNRERLGRGDADVAARVDELIALVLRGARP